MANDYAILKFVNCRVSAFCQILGLIKVMQFKGLNMNANLFDPRFVKHIVYIRPH
jgi:hypothetical protein